MERLSAVFGRRLRALRRAKGLTQEELGRLAGIDYKHIGGIERGEHAPSFDAIEKIVKVLKVEYHDLFAPERSVTGQAEESLHMLLRDIDRVDKAKVKRFFLDLLAAIRRARDG
jgi:transcriptional regulator with XRE-family HTH domain